MERIAGAPFMGKVRVRPAERGRRYLGRGVGAVEESLFVHLVRRVREGQWAEGTTESEYLEDLRAAVRDPSARLALYVLRGGHVAAAFSNNRMPPSRRGPNALDYLFVVYSADRGRIISGYQASSLDAVEVSASPLWVR